MKNHNKTQEKEKEANYIFAKSLLNDLNIAEWSKYQWEELKDSYLQGKVSWETWERYVEEFVNKENIDRIQVMDFKSLMDYKVEPVKWLIKDQIPMGEVGLLAGKRGEGKTWVALKQALGICSGKETFGDEVPEKKTVLFDDEEGGENILANRLQLLAEADGIRKEDLNLVTMSFSGLKLDLVGSKKHQEFCKIIDRVKPDLIIVDCLQRVCSFDIDKDNALISGLFTETVRPLINKYGMSWLFIHHLRKAPTGNNRGSGDPLDEVRGGSELVNYCRYVLGCSTPKNQKNEDGSMMMVLKVLKMSNSTMAEGKVINFLPDDSDPDKSTKISMEYIGKAEDVLNTEERAANAIKEYLFDNGIKEFRTRDILGAEDKIGFKNTNLTKGLKKLTDSGFLDKPKNGYYIIVGKLTRENKKSTLPYGSPDKSLEEQKKDLVKTEDDINDEIIEESLRKKKEKSVKDNPFCSKCQSPIVENKCIDTECDMIPIELKAKAGGKE